MVTRVAARRGIISWLLPCLLLVALSLPALLLRLGSFPAPWHDEGSRTNAARTFADRGVFGTYTVGGLRPFDPYITSGPLDVSAVALSFKLLGTGVAQARLGLLPFALLAVLSLFGVASYAYGARVGLLATLVVLAAPALQGVGLLLLGRQVLGEVPSLALITAGIFLWFLSWRAASGWLLSVLAGVAIGLGLLSKTSIGLGLLPALGLVAAGRGWQQRSAWFRMLAPIAVALGVLAAWRLLEFLLTPPAIYAKNAATLADAIHTLILTMPGSQTPSGTEVLFSTVMLLGAIGGVWRALREGRLLRLASDAAWADLTLALIAGCYALWYALLSIGWPRYAFFGVMIGLLPFTRTVLDVLQRLWPAAAARARRSPGLFYAGTAAMAVLALVVSTWPILTSPASDGAEQVARYIDTRIPPQAVIETWAWELDTLTNHWQFHHPEASYEYLADRQWFDDHTGFNLGYDVLQANPDYLITDAFSDWTGVYNTRVVQQQFVQVAEFGSYRIYQRIGHGSQAAANQASASLAAAPAQVR